MTENISDFDMFVVQPILLKTKLGLISEIKEKMNDKWEQCAGRKGCGYLDTYKRFSEGNRPQRPIKCPNCGKTHTFLVIIEKWKEKILKLMEKKN